MLPVLVRDASVSRRWFRNNHRPPLTPAHLFAQVKDSGRHILTWLKDQLGGVLLPCTGSSLTSDGSDAAGPWPAVKVVFKGQRPADEGSSDGLGAWELQPPAFVVISRMLEAILVRNCEEVWGDIRGHSGKEV